MVIRSSGPKNSGKLLLFHLYLLSFHLHPPISAYTRLDFVLLFFPTLCSHTFIYVTLLQLFFDLMLPTYFLLVVYSLL